MEHTGHDLDGDGVLDDAEIESSTFVCPAAGALTRTSERDPDLDCPAGATVTERGQDLNGNAALDDDEVLGNEVACHDASVFHGDFLGIDWDDPVKVAALELAQHVTGSVTVRTEHLELPALTRIDGNLLVTACSQLDLPKLESVGGQVRLVEKIQVVHLDALNDVGSHLVLVGSHIEELRLPELRRVGGSLRVQKGFDLKVIALPRLSSLPEHLQLDSVPDLETVELPQLHAVEGHVQIGFAPALAALALPELEHVGGSLRVESASALTSLELPKLRAVGTNDAITDGGGVRLAGLAVKNLILPDLVGTKGALTIVHMNGMHVIELPRLRSATELRVEDAPELEEMLAPELEQGSLALVELPELARLKLPSLEHADDVTLVGLGVEGLEGLASLSDAHSLTIVKNEALVSLAGLEHLLKVELPLAIVDNPKLPESEIAALKTRIGQP